MHPHPPVRAAATGGTAYRYGVVTLRRFQARPEASVSSSGDQLSEGHQLLAVWAETAIPDAFCPRIAVWTALLQQACLTGGAFVHGHSPGRGARRRAERCYDERLLTLAPGTLATAIRAVPLPARWDIAATADRAHDAGVSATAGPEFAAHATPPSSAVPVGSSGLSNRGLTTLARDSALR